MGTAEGVVPKNTLQVNDNSLTQFSVMTSVILRPDRSGYFLVVDRPDSDEFAVLDGERLRPGSDGIRRVREAVAVNRVRDDRCFPGATAAPS